MGKEKKMYIQFWEKKKGFDGGGCVVVEGVAFGCDMVEGGGARENIGL